MCKDEVCDHSISNTPQFPNPCCNESSPKLKNVIRLLKIHFFVQNFPLLLFDWQVNITQHSQIGCKLYSSILLHEHSPHHITFNPKRKRKHLFSSKKKKLSWHVYVLFPKPFNKRINLNLISNPWHIFFNKSFY